MIKIQKASEEAEMKTCGIVYGPPGAGKTASIPFLLPGERKLILDIDRSSQVLRSRKAQAVIPGLKEAVASVDIVEIGLDMARWVEAVKWLEDGGWRDYALIVVDNMSELEHQMLTEYGRIGKNDGAPELLHYNRVQFKMVDYVRRFRAMGTNTIFTAWEERMDIVQTDGQKYTQLVPRLSGKSMDTVCGLCNVVARLSMGKEQRYFHLERTNTIYAKDQVQGRKHCAIPELI
jgi:phage nucleotide-binding protein